jgi:uncharacterized membrane protein HdeD (DUF308 family)
MLATLSSRWWALLLSGICAIVAGVIAIMVPGIALKSLVILFAVFAMADGIASIMLGIRGEADGTYWWTMILLGVLAIIAAVGAIAYPSITLLVLLSFVAVTAILRGIFQIVAAVKLREAIDDEWVLGLSGALSVIFGGLLLARPVVGMAVMAIMLGAYMLSIGALEIALALRLRKVHSRLKSGAQALAA